MRRVTAATIVVGALAAAAGGGWVAARRIESPAAAAAAAAPPAPSRLTVPVERRVLSSSLVARGLVRYGDPKEVALPRSAVKAGTNAVVSQPPVKGAVLKVGD